ncbi:MAG: type VI secretion system baseplate subunit TssG [Pseudomonadota bacterium]
MKTRRDLLRKEPYRFSFFGLLREFERGASDKPRIGANLTLGEEIVSVGQDPYLEFPPSNVSAFEEADGKRPALRTRFMGYFGPQGALPLAFSEEAAEWMRRRNKAFVRFADVFAARFYQLIYRVWSGSRAVTQFDRPDEDRFQAELGALAGLPTGDDAMGDSLGPFTRLHFTGLLTGRVRNPGCLRQVLESALGVRVEVQEYVPMWIAFEKEDLAQLGQSGSSLGVDMHLGSRVQTVNEKIRIRVRTETRAQYDSFLPGGSNFDCLSDLAIAYLGPFIDVEIAPALPRHQITGATLGGSGALGRSGWISPDTKTNPEEYVSDAIFAATDQRTRRQNQPAAA